MESSNKGTPCASQAGQTSLLSLTAGQQPFLYQYRTLSQWRVLLCLPSSFYDILTDGFKVGDLVADPHPPNLHTRVPGSESRVDRARIDPRTRCAMWTPTSNTVSWSVIPMVAVCWMSVPW